MILPGDPRCASMFLTSFQSSNSSLFTVPYLVHTANGAKYRYLYGKTRQAVAEKLTKAMADRDGGLIFDAGKVTLGGYLDRWLADSVKGTGRTAPYARRAASVGR